MDTKQHGRAARRARRGVAVLAGTALAGVFLVPVQAQEFPKPGNYETVTEMSMPGMPMKMPPSKSSVCVTSTDPKDFASHHQDSRCKVSDYKVTGNRATFTSTCPTGTAHVEATFTRNSFTSVVTMTGGNAGARTMTMTGKRIGDCAK